ncbi:MAG: hypothetical protein M3121_01215, partial [Chloroflexota bacterium]|nr:hypothetical protein [Chloroflexota bacterium]
YGTVHSERLLYWVVSPIVGLTVATLATSISVVVVSLVTRFIPPRRGRIFLLAISLLMMSVTAMAWSALSPRPQVLGEVVDRDEYRPLWSALSWTPVGWGAKAMTEAATGSSVRALMLVALLVTTSAIATAMAYNVFKRTFIRGLTQTRAIQTTEPNESLTRWIRYMSTPLPRRLGAVVHKEWLVLFRDMRRLTGAAWPVGLVLIYTVVLGRGSDSAFGSDDLRFWSRNGSLALLPWGLSLGISVYSVGSEGRNVHLLRALPMSAGQIFLAKVLASMLPVAFISLSAASASLWLRDAPLLPAIELLALIAWMVVGYVVIDTAAAALAPNFESDQIQRTIGLTGRLFSFAAGSVFGVATVIAAGRLVLLPLDPPASIAGILSIDAGGVEIFGWPLIVLSIGIAVAVVGFSSLIAIEQTRRLILSGA